MQISLSSALSSVQGWWTAVNLTHYPVVHIIQRDALVLCVAARLQTSICTELIKRLLEFGPCLAAAAAAVAELDCLASFAAAARELGYVRPTLTTDDVLLIEGGGASANKSVC